MKRGGYTYIMMSQNRQVLYIGTTSNLIKRVYQHKTGIYKGFTSKYNCNILVYYETYPRMEEAIQREKQLKKWKRQWKLDLIGNYNPNLADLYNNIQEQDLT